MAKKKKNASQALVKAILGDLQDASRVVEANNSNTSVGRALLGASQDSLTPEELSALVTNNGPVGILSEVKKNHNLNLISANKDTPFEDLPDLKTIVTSRGSPAKGSGHPLKPLAPTDMPDLPETSGGSSEPSIRAVDPVESLDKTLVAPSVATNKSGEASATPIAEPRPSEFPWSKQTFSAEKQTAARGNDLNTSHNYKWAQDRITGLEKEVFDLQKDRELLRSASETAKAKIEELIEKIHRLERNNSDLKESNQSELQVFKDGLNAKEKENRKLKLRIDELNTQLSFDLKRVRVRERELENRLELLKQEKLTVLRAKDETILELKKEIDFISSEIETSKQKIGSLQAELRSNQEQFGRTVRALRLALTNLDQTEEVTNPIKYKKAD